MTGLLLRLRKQAALAEPDFLERKKLQEELRELHRQMESVESCFNMVADSDMLDSLIYQRNGLMARYGYLIKRAKELHLVSTAPIISAK